MGVMHVRSDRSFHFDASADAFWSAIATVGEYRRWWPWLRHFEARGLVVGDRWRCVVQPPLPYGLRFVLGIEEVVPSRMIRVSVSGDLQGEARLDVDDATNGSDVRLRSDLSPVAALPRAVATMAPPVARFGHDWVLDNGIRQFRQRALPAPT
jgi:Polyketide cyclase / dehydrase and lipid transport